MQTTDGKQVWIWTDWVHADPDEALSACDLRDYAREEPGGECYRVDVQDQAERIDVLYYPDAGRAGLACGGDAVWTDCDSVEDAVERYLNINGKKIVE